MLRLSISALDILQPAVIVLFYIVSVSYTHLTLPTNSRV